MASLLKHSSACLPMWLAIVCEEMRVFGDFATITEKIEGFPDHLEELMQDVLKRLLREDETQFMEKVSLLFCYRVTCWKLYKKDQISKPASKLH